jgi:hypothetical protein
LFEEHHMGDSESVLGLRSAGIRGRVTVKETIPAGPAEFRAGPDEMDFRGMARWAMNYLEHNPNPEWDYHAQFRVYPLGIPAIPPGPDPIAVGDTDCRMDWEFWNMREILGIKDPTPAEVGLRRHILKYVKDDGFAWCEMGAAEEGKIYDGQDITPGLGLGSGTGGRILVSLCEDYKRNGNERSMAQARKMAHALTTLATWDTGRAYHAEGSGFWVDGKVIKTGWERQFPTDGLYLMMYYLASGDEEILRYCRAFADGFIAELQPNRDIARINPDGSHRGHAHITMHAVWGVALLGEVLGHPKYLEFARRVYEFQRGHGYDTGWMAAAYWDLNVERFCETCATSDMMSTAACLARAGYSEYWDHIERFVRNYIRHAQFFITPEYEKYYRSLHPGKDREVDENLKALRRMEGGFCGSPGPNDMVGWLMNPQHMNVSGCCSPEGMRAVHTAWKNTVVEKPDRVLVNMSLPVDHPAATVTTGLPDQGAMGVTVCREKDFYLRPPAWTARNRVRAFVNAKEITPEWRSDYIYFARPMKGDALVITYPLISFEQRMGLDALREGGEETGESMVIINSRAAKDEVDNYGRSLMTYTWKGNSVVAVHPAGPHIPIYRGPGRPLPAHRQEIPR